MIAVVIAALALPPAGPALAQKKKVAMGCTQTVSSQYAYCVGQAKAINTLSADLNVIVVETGATLDNLKRMAKNQIDYGLVTPAMVYLAHQGLEPFKGAPMPDVRNLWNYIVSANYLSVRADSGVQTPADLTGRKFNPGMRGSATEKEIELALSVLGIKPEFVRGGTADATDAMQDKRIVGYAKSGSGLALDASTMDIATYTPIRVLEFTEEQMKRVRAVAPYMAWVKVPAGTIKGMGEFWTPSTVVGFATLKSMPDDVAYKIVKAVMEGQEYQRAAFKGMTDDLVGLTMTQSLSPLHAGAIKYYREKGVKIPDALIPPEAK